MEQSAEHRTGPARGRSLRPAALTPGRVEAILDRLAKNQPVRRNLPVWGRLHIDRQLPFLCVYRRPEDRADAGTGRLCVGEASYLLASGEARCRRELRNLVLEVADLMVERFGAFLVMELWSADAAPDAPDEMPPPARFTVYEPPGDALSRPVQVLQEHLRRIRIMKQPSEVALRSSRRRCPPGLSPLVPSAGADEQGVYTLGLEVAPIYRDPATGQPFPLLLRALRRQLGHVLDRLFYTFAVENTTHQPRHYHALGRRAMVKAVWETDRRLAAVGNSFDLLYQATPVNAEAAWHRFERDRFERAPDFLYRPRTIDPGRMKRVLYDIPVERVEDPTLAHLFLSKQMELDRQLTMLQDLGTRSFFYGSLQLHGPVPRPILRLARQILGATSARSNGNGRGGYLTAAEFAALARREIAWYRRRSPDFAAKVRVADDMYSGLLVSRGHLFVGKSTRIPLRRADALLQHEVGTHLLTYYNGRSQPFNMLAAGLPGYDELQEGLAVLSEYLAGGLGPGRLRLLAARAVSAHALVRGAGFVDVFRLLRDEHGFTRLAAYTVTMRVFRGGGLVKDAVYLRGLAGILAYMGDGGDLGQMFIGKIAAHHVGMVEELLHRHILKPVPILPRHFHDKAPGRRRAALERGMNVLELIRKPRRPS